MAADMARIALVIAAVVVAAVLIWRPPAPVAPVALTSEAAAPPRRQPHVKAPPSDALVVYVAGAVEHPGLYRLGSGARANDAVSRAGGMRADADATAIDLAEHINDGDEILVPVLGEPTPRSVRSGVQKKRTKSASVKAENVNSATAAELATVPGIGKTLAARIVDVRERDGAFATFDELLDVAGMTAARLARAEPYLRI